MNLHGGITEPDNLRKLFHAIAELHENLRGAFNKSNSQRMELWPVSRNDMVDGLVSIAHFCRSLEGFDRYGNVFDQFSSVLTDLDRGKRHPILIPKGGKGKPPESTDIVTARCRVAIAVTYLMYAGREMKEATNEIARRHPTLDSLVKSVGNRRTKLSISIANWREEFRKGKIKNQEARDLYRSFMHRVSTLKQRKALSESWLVKEAHFQSALAAGFIPMSEGRVLSSLNYIQQKRVPKRVLKARHRGN